MIGSRSADPAVTGGLRAAIDAPLQDVLARLRELDPGDAFDPRIPAAVVATGLHRLPVPESHGGLGASMSEAAAVLLALGAVDGSTALGFAMHVHAVGSIAESATWPAATRDRVYATILEQGALVNNAATEEGGGSPARGAIPGTVAEPDGAGWRLTGEKTWTTWLPALRLAFVSARLAEDAASTARAPVVGVFLLDLESDGVERREAFEALGMRGSASGRLVLDGVRVPGDALIVRRQADAPDPRGAAPGAWFSMSIAATYLGVGEGARSAVARWALDRRPGDGSTAVAEIPSVQLRLGRLDAALRVARLVLLDTTRRWDEAPDGDARQALVPDLALAKVTTTNAAVTATDEALRIAGGPGFLAGPLERAFRDARAGLINPPLDDVALVGFGRAVLEREGPG
jgi:alkylation response protein AidB-like acyl-CoA dehydrogenase